jgi:serine protease AprX
LEEEQMPNHGLRPAARFRRLTHAFLGCAALAAVTALSGAAATNSTTPATNSRAATVNPALAAQVAAKPTGGVTAIITTWSRDGLDAVDALGVRGTKLKSLPMLITPSLTLAQLRRLEASPAVRSIWPQQTYRVFMEDTTWITKARYVWSTSTPNGGPKGYGVTGAGIELAMIDTGFDGLHEDGDNLVEFCDATNIAAATSDRHNVDCTPWVASFNNAPAGACGLAQPGPSNLGAVAACRNKARGDSEDPDVSHGTHVGGTIVGTGHASGGKGFSHSTIGLAPDAKFRVYSANVGPSLLNTQTLAAYDDLTYKKEQGYNKVVAVNNSWGGTGGGNYNPSDPQHIAFKRAYDAGIVSVFAAGNSGPEHNTLSPQCVNPYVVCVAASTKPDSIVAFSSKGRPSQPSDTNRDGTINASDVQPDNHDRLLGQKLGLGLYRPTLAAPGVNINSMKAIGANIGSPDAATCREDDFIPILGRAQNCYVQANGTSMATPHVTGAIGLIAQAFKQSHGRLPRPAEVIDILERSANTAKLPGWESEEQGAGRLDVHQAVRYAKSEISLRKPVFGFTTPPYVDYGAFTNVKGCTGTGSWSARTLPAGPIDGIDLPPLSTARYGQHFITVPPNTERLRITITWPGHPAANLYARLWRPGVNPENEGQTPDAGPPPAFAGRPSAYHQARAWPDQEAVGLPTGPPPTYRLVEVRAPENTDSSLEGAAPPAIPSGKWVLRVYHRAGGVGDACDAASQETPKQPEGFDYNLKVELPQVTLRPSAKITSALGGTQSNRIVAVDGRASYPPPNAPDPMARTVGASWEGITNWAAPGSSQPVGEEPANDTRPVLYLHGNTEEGCVGNGELDLTACNGPFLLPKPQLSAGPAAFWRSGIDDEVFTGGNDRTIHDVNFSWCLAAGPGCPPVPQTGVPAGPQTIGGPLTVEWWAQCNLCGGIFNADWVIRVWGDGVLKHEQRVGATPPVLGEPGRLKATVNVPTFTANQRITVHVDPVFVDSQTVTLVFYDSESPCMPQAPAGSRCDSLVRMPVGATGGSGGTSAPPANLRVTDVATTRALRVAWDKQDPAPARYELYRSTDPVFPGGGTRITGPFADCVSPQAPTPGQPSGHDRSGLCYTDTGVAYGTVYYYRVVSVRKNAQNQDVKSAYSAIAYGMPSRFDRQVKLKVDRLYGAQHWESALVPPSPTPPDTENAGTNWSFAWDTLELEGRHLVFARSFTQGIGSAKDGKPVTLDDDGGGGPGPGPGCPDDDDGDGDDDDDDHDSDDDGDDGDDDCEDDDDHEEEDDD